MLPTFFVGRNSFRPISPPCKAELPRSELYSECVPCTTAQRLETAKRLPHWAPKSMAKNGDCFKIWNRIFMVHHSSSFYHLNCISLAPSTDLRETPNTWNGLGYMLLMPMHVARRHLCLQQPSGSAQNLEWWVPLRSQIFQTCSFVVSQSPR